MENDLGAKQFERSYSDSGFVRSLRQVKHAAIARKHIDRHVGSFIKSMEVPQERIESQLGEPLEGKRILEVGPGQGLERARYFGAKNDVVVLDRDVVVEGFDPRQYWQIARTNGVGRMAKTVGGFLLIRRARLAAFTKALGSDAGTPTIQQGDLERDALPPESFDVIVNWSVFEHLSDPRWALENVISALKPGGVLHISIHVYTAHDGHHDIRAFTGQGHLLPLWGHLRPAHQHEIRPSSYLNEWRMAQWRELFGELAPGAAEYVDMYEARDRFGEALTPEIREELREYTDEELFAINLVFVWKKASA